MGLYNQLVELDRLYEGAGFNDGKEVADYNSGLKSAIKNVEKIRYMLQKLASKEDISATNRANVRAKIEKCDKLLEELKAAPQFNPHLVIKVIYFFCQLLNVLGVIIGIAAVGMSLGVWLGFGDLGGLTTHLFVQGGFSAIWYAICFKLFQYVYRMILLALTARTNDPTVKVKGQALIDQAKQVMTQAKQEAQKAKR